MNSRSVETPRHSSPARVEDQIAGLTKCLVDFLNEAAIEEQLGGANGT